MMCLHCVYMKERGPENTEYEAVDSVVGYRAASVVGAQRLELGGFTLIELLAVVAIIAIIAGLTLGTLGFVNRKGAESRAKAEVAALSAALDSYKLDYGSFPASNNLYTELTGQGPLNTNKVYFEPKGSIVTNTQTGPFLDPWGSPYNYVNPGTNNVGFFDLWTSNNAPTNPALWIRN